ncbi:MAG: DNA polymerase Y family protein [Pseudomonadota bacterium]
MTNKAIISIWLPHWPMDRFLKAQPLEDGTVCALTQDAQHGPVVYDVNPAALAAGVRRGQRVVDARTLCPQLMTPEADPSGDKRALRRLAAWCRRWSPWVTLDGKDGLLIDATGCAHLFGGPQAMLQAIEDRFAAININIRTAMAPTRGAAWALSRYGPARQVVVRTQAHALSQTTNPSSSSSPPFPNPAPNRGTENIANLSPALGENLGGGLHETKAGIGLVKALSGLPVAALRIPAEAELLLRRVGLKTIGHLMQVPRAALAVRFNEGRLKTLPKDTPHPLTRLDQALGLLEEPISPVPHRPRPRVFQALLEPIGHVEAVDHVLGDLARRLCALMETSGHGTRALKLEGYRVDGGRACVHVAASRPTRTAHHIRRLFQDRLETMDAGFGFDALALEAVRTEPLQLADTDLSGAANLNGDAAQLIDRLTGRLGSAAVLRPVLEESHMPERAVSWLPALDYRPPAKPATFPKLLRPHRLLEPPEHIDVTYGVPEDPPKSFTWRRQLHIVRRVEGPERLAPEWWRTGGGARLRDYYRVEDNGGKRFWLFRHGLFGDGRSEAAPRWFLHGLFG